MPRQFLVNKGPFALLFNSNYETILETLKNTFELAYAIVDTAKLFSVDRTTEL